MIKWLKQTFCLHKWECIGEPMCLDYKPWFKCKKCGKEEGLNL